ncbi:hypothetical protein [Cereibacter changlensis]|uniref:hypothetical protein n=1 Tax=Cereibacter changlensis TaxID=402884 RepID=UPI004033AE4F
MLSGKFSWLTEPGSAAKPNFDLVVFENEHFVALPSLGALVDFWILIVPKRPMPNIAAITDVERCSLLHIRSEIRKRASRMSGGADLYEFEHGGSLGGIVSCGVDQAHLHMVNLPFDLLSECEASEHDWREGGDAAELSIDTTNGKEYLFAQCGARSKIANPQSKTSQWFRMLIARKLGENAWDYKAEPYLNRVWAMSENFGNVA